MTNDLRPTSDSLRRPSHALLFILVLVLSACSADDPTRPQSVEGSALESSSPGASLPDVSDFDEDEIDRSDIEYDGEDGPFQHVIKVESGLELIFRFNGKIRAREEVSVTLRARDGDGAPVRGEVEVDFGDGRPTRTFEIDRTAELTHTYRKFGRYRIFAIVRAEDGRQARGGFRLVVDKMTRVDLDAEIVESGGPGEETIIEVTARGRVRGEDESRPTEGELTIFFGDGESAFVKNFESRARRKHVYDEPGDYVVTLLLVMNDREFDEKVKIEIEEEPTGGDGDQFDLSTATVMANSASDIASWNVTSTVTGVRISPNEICIGHTKAGGWPVWSGVEGNPWVVANIGGRWYAGTYEWLRPGQTCKAITAGNIGPHIKFPPMTSWRPRQGEVVYLFVSTVSRLGARSTNERTNAVRVVWPY